MNMGVHLHILSCFWRRYRENVVCVVWSVYWLLSSYIIDVKIWQCFLCSDTVLAHRYRHQNTADFGQNMFFLASVAEQFHLINSPVCLYEQRSENTDVILLVKSEAHQFWLYLGVFWTVNSENSNNCLFFLLLWETTGTSDRGLENYSSFFFSPRKCIFGAVKRSGGD